MAERRAFIEAIEAADARLMSVATFVEISIVLETRHGAEGVRDLDHFIGRAGIELVPADIEHGKLACSAFSRFGKGRHRADLNFGDCFSYALALSTGEPLLFKGDAFVHTDVTIVDLGPRRTARIDLSASLGLFLRRAAFRRSSPFLISALGKTTARTHDRGRALAGRRHVGGACQDGDLPLSSRSSQPRARRQSRMTVSGDTWSAAAVSPTLKPPKYRSTTTWLLRGSTWASAVNAYPAQ